MQFSADAESEEEAEMEAEMRRGFFGRRKRAKDRRKVQKVQGKAKPCNPRHLDRIEGRRTCV